MGTASGSSLSGACAWQPRQTIRDAKSALHVFCFSGSSLRGNEWGVGGQQGCPSKLPSPKSLRASRDAGATKRGGRGPSASLRVNKARPYDAMQVNISEVDDGKEKAGEVPGSERDAPTGVPDRIGAGGVNSRRGTRRNMRGRKLRRYELAR